MGAHVRLADYPDATVRVACRKCNRRGQYRRSSLTALYGDKPALPDVLGQLAHDCCKRNAIANDTCAVYFPDLVECVRHRKSAR